VASGFGQKSNWYQNIIKTPDVTIQAGGKSILVRAETLAAEDARTVFLAYNQEHPNAIKSLAKIVGYPIGDTEEEMMAFLALIPVVAFHPT